MVSAGHPPPAVVDPDGTVSYVPLNPGPPLGVNGLPFEVAEVQLAPGSLLVLYTDGLIEGRESDLDEGMAELRRRLSRPGAATAPLRELGQEIISTHPRTNSPTTSRCCSPAPMRCRPRTPRSGRWTPTRSPSPGSGRKRPGS